MWLLCQTRRHYLHVLNGAAESVRHDAVVDVLLAQAEIGELHVALRVQQNVLRLQITIDDAQRVQMLQRENDLGQVESARNRVSLSLSLSPSKIRAKPLTWWCPRGICPHAPDA